MRLPAAWTGYRDWQLRRLSLAGLERLVKREPANAQARYLLGLAYVRANRYYDGARELLAAQKAWPTRADILNDLGVAYLLQQRYYESLVALQGALTVRPNFAAAWANLGRLHIATQMPYTAATELDRAARLDPRDVETLCDLGQARQQTLNLKGARDAYQRALQLRPKHVRAHVGMGQTLYAMARYDDSEAALRRALSLRPEEATALAALARLRIERATSDADLQVARDLLLRTTRADPGAPDAWYDLGRVSLRLGQAKEAIDHQLRAIALSPDHKGALHQIERALRADGRTAAADRAAVVLRNRSMREREEGQLEERMARVPDDWDARARLTELYLMSGNQGLALLLYRQLKEGRPDHPRLPLLTRMLHPAPPPPLPPLMGGGS